MNCGIISGSFASGVFLVRFFRFLSFFTLLVFALLPVIQNDVYILPVY